MIAVGEFLSGEDDEARTITLDFLIGIYPVTNAQNKKFIDPNPVYPIPAHWF